MTKMLWAYLFCSLLFFKSIASSTDDTESSAVAIAPSVDDNSVDEDDNDSEATVSPKTPYYVKDRRSLTWTSTNMTENPIVFSVTEGYFISVTVSGVNMSYGNYLLIQAGRSRSNDAAEGRVFANIVKGPMSYLFRFSEVSAFCENTVEPATFQFTVVFEQFGDLTTTEVVSTTTPITVPPTQPNVAMYITVNLSGKLLEEYNNTSTKESFQECVALMAGHFCTDNSINLTKNITKEYVMISKIAQCPYRWQDSRTCVKITFRLPIFYEGSSHEYKLASNELETMWSRWEELDDQCLANNGFYVYEEPDVDTAIVWWAIGISLVTIALIVLLWFLRTFGSNIRSVIRKRHFHTRSDTESILTRSSLSSLSPHYLQDTPKLFEN